jgi:TonB family protein
LARRAEAEFQEVLRLDPNNKTALASLASLSYQQAHGMTDFAQRLPKLDESAAWYQRLLVVDPANREAYYSLGVIDWMKWYSAWLQTRAGMGMKPSDPGPMPITAVRHQLEEQYSGVIADGIAQLQRALEIDPQYDDAMAYLNLFIRERADLRDTPEEYRRDVALADDWVQKALETKKMKTPATPAQAPQRIRVGGNVQAANLTRKVAPVYPVEAKAAGIQGTVQFTAVIAKSGVIQTLTLVSGHPALVDAARQAVEQWVYKPTLLNGQPVEVVTQIDVNFTLQL